MRWHMVYPLTEKNLSGGNDTTATSSTVAQNPDLGGWSMAQQEIRAARTPLGWDTATKDRWYSDDSC
jgi:hypothetical protein